MGMVLWALLGCFGSGSVTPVPDAKPTPADAPNVIFLSLDTVRADRLTPYGYERDTTPFLQSLAERGVIFTDSYAQAPMTTPSHAAMFSGMHLFEHHTFKTSHRLPGSIQTLAETFQANGYTTFARASSVRFHPSIDFDQGFDDYKAYWDIRKNARSRRIISEFLDFAAQQDSAPVFAFVHLFDPHAPYNTPEPFVSTWTEIRTDFPAIQSVDYVRTHREPDKAYEPDDLRYIQDLYDGGLRFTDHQVEQMMSKLSIPNGRSTLLVITSDHGEAFKEHGYLGHSHWLYEEIVRVPLMFVWEGQLTGGQQHDTPAHNIDIYPTLMDLIGLQGPPGLSGRSFAALMRGQAEPAVPVGEGLHDPLLLQSNRRDWSILATINGQRYKLVKRHKKSPKLYNLTSDPSGFLNIAPRNKDIEEMIMAYARELGVMRRGAQADENQRDVSSDELDMLRALGYVDEQDH